MEGEMLSKTLKSFVEPIVKFCCSQFPKKCNLCGKEYVDFKSFLEQTTPAGSVTNGVKYHSQKGDIFGILSWVSCKCGATMTISCTDSEKEMHRMFKEAILNEAKEQNTTPKNVLNEIRQEIRKTIISE
ncbi:MAG: hypothetical protein H8E41_10420 [Desulfobulbaceae bacterium]|uniref:Uncharacterized protein n=1 Tax=Candidatus Desulfobia pelagia TaxID=2841692 RepID=A0A8J6NGS4_9BACT|nr:hypothetical protein [Candidatus Desulfobia pelagia]